MKRLSILFFILLSYLGAVAQTRQEEAYKIKVGEPAPNVNIIGPDGKSNKLSALKGKVVMLQISAKGSTLFFGETPYNENAIWHVINDNPEFELYGMEKNDTDEIVANFIRVTKGVYSLEINPEHMTFKQYDEPKSGFTRNVIIDKQGNVAMLTNVSDRADFNKMVTLIDQLLSE